MIPTFLIPLLNEREVFAGLCEIPRESLGETWQVGVDELLLAGVTSQHLLGEGPLLGGARQLAHARLTDGGRILVAPVVILGLVDACQAPEMDLGFSRAEKKKRRNEKRTA